VRGGFICGVVESGVLHAGAAGILCGRGERHDGSGVHGGVGDGQRRDGRDVVHRVRGGFVCGVVESGVVHAGAAGILCGCCGRYDRGSRPGRILCGRGERHDGSGVHGRVGDGQRRDGRDVVHGVRGGFVCSVVESGVMHSSSSRVLCAGVIGDDGSRVYCRIGDGNCRHGCNVLHCVRSGKVSCWRGSAECVQWLPCG
jgi:hypothetical protein